MAGPERNPSQDRALVPVPPAKPSSLRRLAGLGASVPASADLVLLGDSLAAAWPGTDLRDAGTARAPFNFGLPGDRIANALWRLDALATGHLRPDAAVLLLGTNDLGDGAAPEVIVAGLGRVARRLLDLWSPPALVVVGLPWRRPDGRDREADRLAVNAALAAGGAARGAGFLDPDPVIGVGPAETRDTVSPDGLHLAEAAYPRLSKALAERLAGLRRP